MGLAALAFYTIAWVGAMRWERDDRIVVFYIGTLVWLIAAMLLVLLPMLPPEN
jgi:hypothetical protein